MPCIVMYTNVEVPKEKADELKKALVVSWEKLPGKSERWLMTTIRDNTTMFFGGKDTPAAFVNFKILGSLGRENCEILNEEFLTDVSQVLGIQKERIFVAHDECPSWGWDKNLTLQKGRYCICPVTSSGPMWRFPATEQRS